MLFVEDIQHFFQCHAVAGLYQNGIAGLHPAQQGIGRVSTPLAAATTAVRLACSP